MQRTAQVVAVEGRQATIRFRRTKACAHCGGCISFGPDHAQVQLTNSLHAQAGDWVVVEMHARGMLEASLLMYILPLVLLLAGVWLGARWSEVWSVVLGLAGAGLVFGVLRLLEPKFARMGRFKPRMISFTENPDGENEGGNEA